MRPINFNAATENILSTIENIVKIAAEQPEHAAFLAYALLDASRDLQREVDQLPLPIPAMKAAS